LFSHASIHHQIHVSEECRADLQDRAAAAVRLDAEAEEKWAALSALFEKYDADHSGALDVKEMSICLKVKLGLSL